MQEHNSRLITIEDRPVENGDITVIDFEGFLGKKAFEGICDKYLTTKNGKLSLGGICLVAGLGPENKPQRDGSYEYYMSESIVEDDAKGVGPFILAYNEYRLLN